MKLGILSDTHDLLRSEVLSAIADVDFILHAGDISSRKIIDQLRKTAPVYAVRGNADKDWAADLPAARSFELDGLNVFMTHRKADLPGDLRPYDLVVFGHSHQYSETYQGKTLILNPGSCGPRRFHQKITLAKAKIEKGRISVTRIDIFHTQSSPKVDPTDIKGQIEIVIREINKGRGNEDIAQKIRYRPGCGRTYCTYLFHPSGCDHRWNHDENGIMNERRFSCGDQA